MTETGVVVKADGNTATVKVDKKDECSKCGMCLFPKGADSVEFQTENSLHANVGDKVVIKTEKDGKLLGAILAFLVPLLLIGVSVLLGYLVLKSEIWILALSVILIAVWYLVLAFIDKKLVKKLGFRPKIIEILEKSEKKEN